MPDLPHSLDNEAELIEQSGTRIQGLLHDPPEAWRRFSQAKQLDNLIETTSHLRAAAVLLRLMADAVSQAPEKARAVGQTEEDDSDG